MSTLFALKLTMKRWVPLGLLLLAGCFVDFPDIAPEATTEAGPSDGDGDDDFDGSAGAGGSDDLGPDDACQAVSQEASTQARPVDIIWAVDTSPSMSAEKQGVRDNLNLFAQQITAADIDVHVVMIASPLSDGGMCIDAPLGSGDCAADHNPPMYHHELDWVGSHNALNRFLWEMPDYKVALRENSIKYFAVVTDDDAEIDAASFTSQLTSIEGGIVQDWKMFGMFCANNDTGQVYKTLVDQSGGIFVELCTSSPNFQAVFDGLAQEVIESKTLDCSWEIPEAPDGQQFNKDKVNVEYTPGDGGAAQSIFYVGDDGMCGTQGGWYYDDASNPSRIEACPVTCDAIQDDLAGKIDILFGCVTELLPN